MRAPGRLLLTLALGVWGCGSGDQVPVPGKEGAFKSTGELRSARRLYDGAPPVIPHEDFGASCGACHDSRGTAVSGVGYAPASPHEATPEGPATVRCRQCHVFAQTDGLFVESDFQGLAQDLRVGSRLYDGAPPTIPHRILMRENCAACHAGPGARPEILTSHPERSRCRQCHVLVTTRDRFPSDRGSAPEGREDS